MLSCPILYSKILVSFSKMFRREGTLSWWKFSGADLRCLMESANWLATLPSFPYSSLIESSWRGNRVRPDALVLSLRPLHPPPLSPKTASQLRVSTNILRKFLTNFFERLVIRTVDILDTWVLLARHQVQRLSDKNVTFFVWRAIISSPGQERSESNSFLSLTSQPPAQLKYFGDCLSKVQRRWSSARKLILIWTVWSCECEDLPVLRAVPYLCL